LGPASRPTAAGTPLTIPTLWLTGCDRCPCPAPRPVAKDG
jgi:hypothetical protein